MPDHPQRRPSRPEDAPRGDRWLAAGLACVAVGLWLLRLDDPLLLTAWGVALLLIGGVIAVVGLGLLLRLWR